MYIDGNRSSETNDCDYWANQSMPSWYSLMACGNIWRRSSPPRYQIHIIHGTARECFIRTHRPRIWSYILSLLHFSFVPVGGWWNAKILFLLQRSILGNFIYNSFFREKENQLSYFLLSFPKHYCIIYKKKCPGGYVSWNNLSFIFKLYYVVWQVYSHFIFCKLYFPQSSIGPKF